MPRIADLIETWKQAGCDDKELTRRLIDLFFVSVLLDAGAGDHWKYIEHKTGGSYERSEGIAVASLYMFLEGGYTDEKSGTPLVDGQCFLSGTFRFVADTIIRKRTGPIDERVTRQRPTSYRE